MRPILEIPRHAYRQHRVDEVGLLIDGEDYYREFYRAALTARRTMVLAGWQFDSDVPLLRGGDVAGLTTPATLLTFLNHLCEQNHDLQIWILAWDFHPVFAAEREWMQQLVFQWSINERLQFRFDSTHVDLGCHHQKFVVIDGELSFAGGMDLCESRWDDRRHRLNNPLRFSHGKPTKPFHDIQAFVRGRALAASLHELFARRWERAGGEPISSQLRPGTGDVSPHPIQNLVPIQAATVALSRTDPHGIPGGPSPCTEVLALHEAAIARADRLIYAETQYLSSHAIAEALEKRMRTGGRPPLELVFILNMRGETLKERAAVGLAQAEIIGRLRQVALETGHRLGIYYALPACEPGEEPWQPVYIHSKLMIVDDRFLTVGSANLTNRSMGYDTELNLTVEAAAETDPLVQSIRRLRMSLLAEHLGAPGPEVSQGLVARLEELAALPGARLRRHGSPTESERTALSLIDPQKLPFDPDHVEGLEEEQKTVFLAGLARAVRGLFPGKSDQG